MSSRWRTVSVEQPGQGSEALLRAARRWLSPVLSALYRPSIEGLEALPRGPFVLVANHSAGLGMAEILCFTMLYLQRFQLSRPLAAMAHPLCWHFWPASILLRHAGAIPSTYEAAEAALAAGVPVLVFPGGDHEAMRPFWQAGRVDFGGRQGFLRLARRAGVPVVPMGCAGSHFTAPILWRSRRLLPWLLGLPRLVGMRRWALSALDVLVVFALWRARGPAVVRAALGWAFLTSPFAFLPLVPATIRFAIGAPLGPKELFERPDAELDAARVRVEAEIERLVAKAAQRCG